MVERDIANCQPLMWGLVMLKNGSASNTTTHTQTPNTTPTTLHPNTHNSICCTKRDFARYVDICSRGKLYEHLLALAQRAGLTLFDFIPAEKRHRHGSNGPLNRDSMKKAFVTVMFAKVELMVQLPIWPILSDEFPTVAAAMVEAKRVDHRHLAHACQRMESKIMVGPGGVADELLKVTDAGIFTIHDAVAVPESLADLATEIIKDKVRPYGAEPTVKS